MPKYDVIIKSHNKDYLKLKYVIDSIKYLIPQPESIYLITPDGYIPPEYVLDTRILAVTDNEVFPSIDRNRLRYRPNWTYSMLMGLFQNVTPNDYYFDIQADNFFVKDIELFEDGKPIFYLAPAYRHYHIPYFVFNQKVLGLEEKPGRDIGIEREDSFITGFMMYDRRISKEMLGIYGGIDQFFDKCVEVIDIRCNLGDYEIYPSWCLAKHPNEYVIRKNLPMWVTGVDYPEDYNDEKIAAAIEFGKTNPANVALSIHTWKMDYSI